MTSELVRGLETVLRRINYLEAVAVDVGRLVARVAELEGRTWSRVEPRVLTLDERKAERLVRLERLERISEAAAELRRVSEAEIVSHPVEWRLLARALDKLEEPA